VAASHKRQPVLLAAHWPLALSEQHAARASAQVTLVHGLTPSTEHGLLVSVPAFAAVAFGRDASYAMTSTLPSAAPRFTTSTLPTALAPEPGTAKLSTVPSQLSSRPLQTSVVAVPAAGALHAAVLRLVHAITPSSRHSPCAPLLQTAPML
jgi:hypothetical protein